MHASLFSSKTASDESQLRTEILIEIGVNTQRRGSEWICSRRSYESAQKFYQSGEEGVLIPVGSGFTAKTAVISHCRQAGGGRIPESMACCAPAWMLYMASYVWGPSSSSFKVSLQTVKSIRAVSS